MSHNLLCVVLCVGVAAHTDVKLRGQADNFIDGVAFKHHLRVCNAYPDKAAVEIYRGSSEKLTEDAPMPYGTCRDFVAPLMSGDKLEFKVGDVVSGAFAVSDLPQNDALLMLVVSRHDNLSTAVAFESHVFANVDDNAEVVIMDAYKGPKEASLNIKDAGKNGKAARSEELRYDSVVAIAPGQYEVDLMGSDGTATAKRNFKAVKNENYVFLRIGIASQELLIYPNSFQSAAAFAKASLALMLLFLSSARWF